MHRLSAAARRGDVSGLRQALRWLDDRLARALDADGPEPPDPFRGLFVTAHQARDLLSRQRAGRTPRGDHLAAEGALAVLAGRFGLSGSDIELLVVALAPELDLRYEQIYGYLQDDVTRRRATVELVLRLVFNDSSHQSPGHVHLWPTAPLVRHGLVETTREPGESGLVADLAVDEQLVRVLLGYTGLDPRLAGVGRLLEPGTCPGVGADATAQRIRSLARDAERRGAGLSIYLREERRGDAADVAMAVAALLGAPLLEVRPAPRSTIPVCSRELIRYPGAVVSREPVGVQCAAHRSALLMPVPVICRRRLAGRTSTSVGRSCRQCRARGQVRRMW